jgi:hypothetical protein
MSSTGPPFNVRVDLRSSVMAVCAGAEGGGEPRAWDHEERADRAQGAFMVVQNWEQPAAAGLLTTSVQSSQRRSARPVHGFGVQELS